MSKEKSNMLNILNKYVSEFLEIENLILTKEMAASDVPEWDSLSHLQIIHGCEQIVGARFTLEEISNLKYIGDLVDLMEKYSN
tara:strand:- start:259 stop:507 length:249 start_codon:yes stop_codon:yes gene_type:complete